MARKCEKRGHIIQANLKEALLYQKVTPIGVESVCLEVKNQVHLKEQLMKMDT
jgi:hypothetical protein